jgi:nucleotide-binding universal stress UspA family protein
VPIPLIGMGDMLDPTTVASLSATAAQEAKRIVSEAVDQAAREGLSITSDIVKQDLTYRAIVDAAGRHGCDLIVMASHGRKGLAGLLLGSETQRVLLHASVPVLVVR